MDKNASEIIITPLSMGETWRPAARDRGKRAVAGKCKGTITANYELPQFRSNFQFTEFS